MENEVVNLNINEIFRNPYQPRKVFDEKKLAELSQSIQVNGILQPIIVRKSNLTGYELLAGERRLRAAKLSNLTEIPAIIRDYSDQEMMFLSIMENIQRDDMNSLDEAESLANLIQKTQMSHEEIAQIIGKSRSYVSNLLRILQLPTIILQMLQNDELKFAHARTLLAVDDENQQIELAKKIVKEKLSVRQIENLVYQKEKIVKSNPKNIFIEETEQNLMKNLGNKVKISQKKNQSGKIEIEFDSLENLEKIVEKLTKNAH